MRKIKARINTSYQYYTGIMDVDTLKFMYAKYVFNQQIYNNLYSVLAYGRI